MKGTLIKEKSSFPLIYEGMVWVLYTVLYKYVYYLGSARLPAITRDNFPHLQIMFYALAMTLYVIPFYRWLAPALLRRRNYKWLVPVTILWFLLVPKLSNVCVSWLFMNSNDAGGYKAFYSMQFFIHKMQAVQVRGWDLPILLTDLIAFSSIAFTRYAFDNELKKRLLEKDVFRLQLDALNAQLNPHFLFNTLNSIYGMSLTGSKDTPEYVLRLADMMRYTLYDCRQDKVELEKDISFTENYIAMEKKRYPLAEIRFTVSNSSAGIFIAPLLLIPFVENSFKHGGHCFNEKGFIHAHLQAGPDQLHFVVENDKLIATNTPAISGGIGIDNVKKRLQMYYTGKHTLKIVNTDTTFKVELTLLFK